jgi:NAD-specific glutamate dehydrogenase
VHAPGIFEVADRSGRSVIEVGRVFFLIGQAVQLDEVAQLLSMSATRDPWQRWARQTIEDDLIGVLRRLAERVLSEAGDDDSGDDAVDSFLSSRAHSLKRVLGLILGRRCYVRPAQDSRGPAADTADFRSTAWQTSRRHK